MRRRRRTKTRKRISETAGSPRRFFYPCSKAEVDPMNAKIATEVPAERWYSPQDKTSATDDERILDITPLPPPEHLIRFFPIRNTPMEKLISGTRGRIRDIMQKKDDRLLV